MDRNTIIGIILIAVIFIFWAQLNKPSEEELRKKREADSLALVNKQIDALERELRTTELNKAKKKSDSLQIAKKAAKLGEELKSTVFGANEFYTIENDLIILTVSSKGGRPYSVELKNYTTHDTLPLILFSGDSTVFNLNFYQGNNAVQTNDLYFKSPTGQSEHVIASEQAGSLNMRLGTENKYLEYVYTLNPGSYKVDLDVRFVGMDDISGKMPGIIDLQWGFYSPRQERGWKNESNYTSLYYRPFNDKVESFRARTNKDVQEETLTTKLEWIAFKDQFFSTVLMADNNFANGSFIATSMPEEGKFIKQFNAELGIPYQHGDDEKIALNFYFGPNHYKLLKKNFEEKRLHDMVNVGGGIIKWINQGIIINIFNWLNKGISNYGVIILLLTLIIKLMLLPLTFRSYMSQAKMRVVKPMVDEATKKIPKEKAMERQQATMAIYKKVGVSPLGGCLPMILQMPILFAMFRFFPTSIELRQQSFLWATDLSTYDALIHWNKSIPLLGNHLSLFTLLMTITTIISMKTNSSAQMSDSQMPGMKTMMYIMPVTFLFVLNDFSAALTYYYFLANLITFGQNFLFKQFVDEEEVLKKLQAKKAKPKKKSRWQQRIEEMQKAQQQAAKKRR